MIKMGDASRKTFLFKEPSHFRFKESGEGVLISKDMVAMISAMDMTAILLLEDSAEIELENVDWVMLIERPDVNIFTYPSKIDTNIAPFDVELSGEIISEKLK